jgi:hypothetical protein
MTTALEGGECSASRPGHTLPPGKTRYPLYRRLSWPQGRSGQVRKISPPTGIRSPDRPARSSVAIPTELPSPLNIQYILYLLPMYYIYELSQATLSCISNDRIILIGWITMRYTTAYLKLILNRLIKMYYYYVSLKINF